jgi:hypothetical protein
MLTLGSATAVMREKIPKTSITIKAVYTIIQLSTKQRCI